MGDFFPSPHRYDYIVSNDRKFPLESLISVENDNFTISSFQPHQIDAQSFFGRSGKTSDHLNDELSKECGNTGKSMLARKFNHMVEYERIGSENSSKTTLSDFIKSSGLDSNMFSSQYNIQDHEIFHQPLKETLRKKNELYDTLQKINNMIKMTISQDFQSIFNGLKPTSELPLEFHETKLLVSSIKADIKDYNENVIGSKLRSSFLKERKKNIISILECVKKLRLVSHALPDLENSLNLPLGSINFSEFFDTSNFFRKMIVGELKGVKSANLISTKLISLTEKASQYLVNHFSNIICDFVFSDAENGWDEKDGQNFVESEKNLQSMNDLCNLEFETGGRELTNKLQHELVPCLVRVRMLHAGISCLREKVLRRAKKVIRSFVQSEITKMKKSQNIKSEQKSLTRIEIQKDENDFPNKNRKSAKLPSLSQSVQSLNSEEWKILWEKSSHIIFAIIKRFAAVNVAIMTKVSENLKDFVILSKESIEIEYAEGRGGSTLDLTVPQPKTKSLTFYNSQEVISNNDDVINTCADELRESSNALCLDNLPSQLALMQQATLLAKGACLVAEECCKGIEEVLEVLLERIEGLMSTRLETSRDAVPKMVVVLVSSTLSLTLLINEVVAQSKFGMARAAVETGKQARLCGGFYHHHASILGISNLESARIASRDSSLTASLRKMVQNHTVEVLKESVQAKAVQLRSLIKVETWETAKQPPIMLVEALGTRLGTDSIAPLWKTTATAPLQKEKSYGGSNTSIKAATLEGSPTMSSSPNVAVNESEEVNLANEHETIGREKQSATVNPVEEFDEKRKSLQRISDPEGIIIDGRPFLLVPFALAALQSILELTDAADSLTNAWNIGDGLGSMYYYSTNNIGDLVSGYLSTLFNHLKDLVRDNVLLGGKPQDGLKRVTVKNLAFASQSLGSFAAILRVIHSRWTSIQGLPEGRSLIPSSNKNFTNENALTRISRLRHVMNRKADALLQTSVEIEGCRTEILTKIKSILLERFNVAIQSAMSTPHTAEPLWNGSVVKGSMGLYPKGLEGVLLIIEGEWPPMHDAWQGFLKELLSVLKVLSKTVDTSTKDKIILRTFAELSTIFSDFLEENSNCSGVLGIRPSRLILDLLLVYSKYCAFKESTGKLLLARAISEIMAEINDKAENHSKGNSVLALPILRIFKKFMDAVEEASQGEEDEPQQPECRSVPPLSEFDHHLHQGEEEGKLNLSNIATTDFVSLKGSVNKEEQKDNTNLNNHQCNNYSTPPLKVDETFDAHEIEEDYAETFDIRGIIWKPKSDIVLINILETLPQSTVLAPPNLSDSTDGSDLFSLRFGDESS